jgi:hypothetical protein
VSFPRLTPEQRERLQKVRLAYDPLAALVPPHITLVFPFASDLTTADLEDHARIEETAQKAPPEQSEGAAVAIVRDLAAGQMHGEEPEVRPEHEQTDHHREHRRQENRAGAHVLGNLG